jgi:cell division septum initiation protein DivIVA
VVTIDILHLVDRLEALLHESWRFPLTSNRFVSEDEILEIIDQMRVSIPQEVRQARRIQQERDRILAQAQEEASRTIALAQERVEALAGQQEVTRTAEARAREVEERAVEEARQIRSEADDYVMGGLERLEEQLVDLLTQVRNGLTVLRGERAQKEGGPAGPAPENGGEVRPGFGESVKEAELAGD